MNVIGWIDQRKHWWKVFVIIFAVSVTVVGYIGYKTYEYAPPIVDFVDEQGQVVFPGTAVTDGQQVFQKYGLMDYGSYLGDGGLRGPDFTAEALSLTSKWMNEYYLARPDESLAKLELDLQAKMVEARVQMELKKNGYDANASRVTLNAAQTAAFHRLVDYYTEVFGQGGKLASKEAFKSKNYITNPKDIHDLTAFFYWGGWLCAAERPGYPYSYTHNWPYDPKAGNTPHGGLVLWSVIGTLFVILTIGVIFYYYGKLDRESLLEAQKAKMPPLATSEVVDRFRPTPTQRACYKYFAVAAILFAIQVFAGLLAISDFVGLFAKFGINISDIIPVTVSRAWHTQISILWIAVCWFAATIWILPLIVRPEPSGQLKWVNVLFWMLAVVGIGGALGLPLGIHGLLDKLDNGNFGLWRWFGMQGWEFMQIGRAYQFLLYASFVVWLIIIARGVWPVLKQRQTWSLPNWMVYSIVGIIFMFSAGFVASPKTNFVVADFWRWCTIHMWVEAFFEVFTTIILAYFLYLMGFVSHAVAARVVYLSAVLFLGSGLIGISHNFYWNAKSIETVALGGVLSSLQVAPLVLLTVEAWRFRHLPDHTLRQMRSRNAFGNGNGAVAEVVRLQNGGRSLTTSATTFGLSEAFLFLVGVNFWNFMGAGVFGFMINLPIVNYYEHGTYLTINHAHAALFGVYGNLAIAAMLFCGRWVIGPERWRPGLLKFAFWGMNVGIALMVVMDLFPVGVHQLMAVMSEGLAYGRSQEYISGTVFQTLTWLRGVGVAFFISGMIPLVWFVVTRGFTLRPVQDAQEMCVVPPSVLAMITPSGNGHREEPARERPVEYQV
jgi:nitric oxide reductase subunit B